MDNNEDFPFTPETGRIVALAATMHELYEGFLAAGFSEAQALALTNSTLQSLIQGAAPGGY
jgi:hypothetical protein